MSVLAAAVSGGRTGPNTFTPTYVFTQDYADAVAPDWSPSGMLGSGVYLVNQSVHPSDASALGHYFHQTI